MEFAERSMRALADHEVNTLGLTGIIVVKEELRVFDQERLAVWVCGSKPGMPERQGARFSLVAITALCLK